MFKKIIAWMLLITVTATVAIGGTLAYLTDRDSEANVFTTGDVDITLNDEFEQESQLKPGVEIEKNISVKNEGPNDAYIWYTYAVPQNLEAGLVLSFEEDTKWSAGELIGAKEVDGVTYNVYASKYSEQVPAGETTDVGLTKVTMDPAVDITPEGDLYKVEAGVTTPLNWNVNTTENPVIFINAYAIQTQDFATVDAAYEAFKGQWGDMVEAGTYEVAKSDTWDGTADTSWYDPANPQTEYEISTAEQLAGLAELVSGETTFDGVTFKLVNNLDLYCEDTSASADGDPVTFRPIGDKSKNGTFEGTFDGDGKTISNLYQNGWDLGYEWGKYGSYGLFGNVNDATIKNLTLSGGESYIEGGDTSFVAGSATGTCVFENITIEDSVSATYNNGNGGIIGWSGEGDYTFKNITIAEDCVLAGLWGSFDSSIGGVVGQGEPGATYNFENVDIACRLDVYNDCTASYDYYNYRMCGMIIGRLEETTTIDGTNYPDTSKYNITCNNVTVTYGDWMNYHYCEPTPGLNGGRGMRVEPGYAYDGLPADYDHSQCVDNHMNLIPFDQIFGGAQLGVKGLKTYDGVTVIYPTNP